MSDLFTTLDCGPPNVAVMDIALTSTVIEIVASDLGRSLDFYRLVGLPVPEPDGPHVEVEVAHIAM